MRTASTTSKVYQGGRTSLRLLLVLISLSCISSLYPFRHLLACCGGGTNIIVTDQTTEESQGDEEDQGYACTGSKANVATGNLVVDLSTPAVPTVQGAVQVVCTYSSRSETTSVPIKAQVLTPVQSADWTIQVVDRTWSGTGAVASATWDTTYSDGTPVSAGGYPYVVTFTGVLSGSTTTISFRERANVLRGYDGPVGYNWSLNYNPSLRENPDGSITMLDQDGTLVEFLAMGYSSGGYYYLPSIPLRVTPRLTKIASPYTGSYTFRLDDKYADQYYFNQGGRLTSIVKKGKLGVTTLRYTLNRDANGNLTSIVDPSGRYTTFAYGGPRIVGITDMAGRRFGLGYDSIGNLTRFTDANGQTTTYSYDATTRNLLSKTDPLGSITKYVYSGEDRLVGVTDPDGNATTFAFDPANGTSTRTDPRGGVTTYRYNNLGEVTAMIDPLGNTTTYTWTPILTTRLTTNRTLESVTNPRGGATYFSYDNMLNVGSICTINGNTTACTSMGYSPWSSDQLTDFIDFNRNRTRLYYDDGINMTSYVDPLGQTTRYTYDGKCQMLTATDPAGNITSFSYDANGNLVSSTDALGKTRSFQYDAAGNLTQETDANGNVTTLAYDNMNNLLQVGYPGGDTLSFSYNANGQMTTSTNPRGGLTRYEYDRLGNVSRVIDPLGNVQSFSYTCCGLLQGRTDARGYTTTYQYDANNRLTGIAYPDGTNVSYSYDANGNPVTMTDQTGSSSLGYDVLNRLTASTNPQGGQLRYNLDKMGNVTSMVYPGGQTVSYQYDALNRLTGVTDWLGRATTYQYDTRGNLLAKTNPNSTRLAVYDAVNRLSSYTDSTAVGLPISGGQYTYDGEGNIVGMTQELPLLPTLTGSQSTYTCDAADQIVSANGVNYTHDANGNLTTTRDAQFSYDYENRLTQAVSTGRTLQYQYDGAGRRVARAVNGAKTGYILNVRPFLYSPIAETDASGNINRYYVYGAMGELVSAIDSTGTEYWYHYDHIGNTLAMTDMNGSVVNRYAYEPFGRLAGQGEAVPNPFKYIGRWGVMEEGNNLYYMRARYYDSSLGRFISRDPMGLRSRGEVSPYVYVGNNPITRIDPLGLWYVDANVSFGFIFGVTGGIMIGSEGIYPYVGAGMVYQPSLLGGAVTFSPNNPTPGWNAGAQGGFGLGGQTGYSFGESRTPFGEIGFVPPGLTVTDYYAWELKWKQLWKWLFGDKCKSKYF